MIVLTSALSGSFENKFVEGIYFISYVLSNTSHFPELITGSRSTLPSGTGDSGKFTTFGKLKDVWECRLLWLRFYWGFLQVEFK